MSRRQELHQKLLGMTDYVYFQPPSNIKIKHPCIIYQRSAINSIRSDDINYRNVSGYTVIVVDANPDSDILEKILTLPMSTFNRHYTADNLNHDVFNVFY